MHNKLKTLFTFAIISTLQISAWAQSNRSEENEVQVARKQIHRALQTFRYLHPEKQDEARLVYLRSVIENVSKSLEENGLGHRRTYLSYQNLIIAFRYSETFFEPFSEEATPRIAELMKVIAEIREKQGIDDSPYSQITANMFQQMHKLVTQITKLPVSDEIKVHAASLQAPIGGVIAIAQQGDRPRTFEAAQPVYYEILKLYDLFTAGSGGTLAFNIVSELKGLVETFGEYAQISRTQNGQW